MEADIRDVVSKLEDSESEPEEVPARYLEEGAEPTRQGRRLTEYQIGLIGGGLIGFAAGMLTAALVVLARKRGGEKANRRSGV